MPRPQVVIPLTVDQTDVVKSITDLKNTFKRSATEINSYFELSMNVARWARILTAPLREWVREARAHSASVKGELDKLVTGTETGFKKLETGLGYFAKSVLSLGGLMDVWWKAANITLNNLGEKLIKVFGDAKDLQERIKDIDAMGDTVGKKPTPDTRGNEMDTEVTGGPAPPTPSLVRDEGRAEREARTKREAEARERNRQEAADAAKKAKDDIVKAWQDQNDLEGKLAEERRKKAQERADKLKQDRIDQWKADMEAEGRATAEAIENMKALQEQERAALAAGAAKRLEQERKDNADIVNERNANAAKTYNMIRDASISAGLEIVSGGIAVATEAAVMGDNVLKALAGFAGGVIKTLGQTLIQLGTAGLLASTLGTAIPVLAPMTGGPPGIGVSLAAIAGGTALVAVGAAMGGKGGGSASGVGASGTVRSWSAPTVASASSSARGTETYAGSTGGTKIVNVYLQGAVVGSTPSEAGRQIQGWIRAAERRGY